MCHTLNCSKLNFSPKSQNLKTLVLFLKFSSFVDIVDGLCVAQWLCVISVWALSLQILTEQICTQVIHKQHPDPDSTVKILNPRECNIKYSVQVCFRRLHFICFTSIDKDNYNISFKLDQNVATAVDTKMVLHTMQSFKFSAAVRSFRFLQHTVVNPIPVDTCLYWADCMKTFFSPQYFVAIVALHCPKVCSGH